MAQARDDGCDDSTVDSMAPHNNDDCCVGDAWR